MTLNLSQGIREDLPDMEIDVCVVMEKQLNRFSVSDELRLRHWEGNGDESETQTRRVYMCT